MTLQLLLNSRNYFRDSFLFLLFLVCPIVINLIFLSNSLIYAGLHEVICELGLAFVGFYVYGDKYHVSHRKYINYFSCSFFSLAIADFIYIFTANISFAALEKPWLVFIREIAYLMFSYFLLIDLIKNMKSHFFDKISLVVIGFVFSVFFILNIKYNLSPLLANQNVSIFLLLAVLLILFLNL